ncbi:MAG: hypothetical protein ACLFOY_06010 [Desulfatibacillaceae bacterium]
MKARRVVLALALALAMVLVATPGWAGMGIGGYVTGSFGGSDIEEEWQNGFENVDYDPDTSALGGGFVLDTNLNGTQLFNYRLYAGYERAVVERENITVTDSTGTQTLAMPVDYEFDRYLTDHCFGFALISDDMLRVWAGPMVRLSYETYEDVTRHYTGGGYMDERNDIQAWGFGGGGIVGINVHITPTMSVCGDAGYRVTGYWGENERAMAGTATNASITEYDYTDVESSFFGNVSFMVSFN